MLTGLAQPVGQKRLTNVAVVRLKKHGNRFEVACYKNKVLSWRSGVEKDLDEVLHSETIYANVSRGILAKSKDLLDAFGVSDQTKICLEILEKGELQVAGKERESVLSKQFNEVATLVMQKTMNPETRRPYTITMIERLMHRIHFGVDPTSSSKKQALEVIHELQKRYPIKKSPMKLRLTVPKPKTAVLRDKLRGWNADVAAEEECENDSRYSVTCEMDPGFFRECDASLRSMQGWSEILVISMHVDTETGEDYDGRDEDGAEKMKKRSVSSKTGSCRADAVPVVKTEVIKEMNKCSTCNVVVDDAKKYREHFKSEWHIHNLRRKTMKLPPLTADECKVDHKNKRRSDRKDYSF